MLGVSPDLNLTPLATFFTFFAERQKREKAARGVRFKSGLVWRLLRVLCFDLTYLCNKDENRWNDDFFVSEDLIHRFPSVDEHAHGLEFDDWVTITCLNYQNLPEMEHPKRRTPLVFISQPGSAVLIVTSPGSAFTRRFPLCQLDRVREDSVNDGSAWSEPVARVTEEIIFPTEFKFDGNIIWLGFTSLTEWYGVSKGHLSRDLPISVNHLPISVNELPISGNDLPISGNDLPISVNELPI